MVLATAILPNVPKKTDVETFDLRALHHQLNVLKSGKDA